MLSTDGNGNGTLKKNRNVPMPLSIPSNSQPSKPLGAKKNIFGLTILTNSSNDPINVDKSNDASNEDEVQFRNNQPKSKFTSLSETSKARASSRCSTGPCNVAAVRSRLENDELDDNQRQRLSEFILAKMEIGELVPEEFEKLSELGTGNGGVVRKVRHTRTGMIMAKKMIHLEIQPAVQSQIIRELKILHDCNSPYIVGYYGAFNADGDISICMEYMDGGSLDKVLKEAGRMPEPILSIILYSVLKGLLYLHDTLSIIHRDVKPSNILVKRNGEIKLCDFGVSGQLIDSLANSFVGTRSYMAPERLSGEVYKTASDIWSLGLSLVELATGRYPIPAFEEEDLFANNAFSKDRSANLEQHLATAKKGSVLTPVPNNHSSPLVIFELMTYIVDQPPPKLYSVGFTDDFIDLVNSCLYKDSKDRRDLKQLLEHPFVRTVGSLHPDGVDRRGSVCLQSPSASTTSPSNTGAGGNHSLHAQKSFQSSVVRNEDLARLVGNYLSVVLSDPEPTSEP